MVYLKDLKVGDFVYTIASYPVEGSEPLNIPFMDKVTKIEETEKGYLLHLEKLEPLFQNKFLGRLITLETDVENYVDTLRDKDTIFFIHLHKEETEMFKQYSRENFKKE